MRPQERDGRRHARHRLHGEVLLGWGTCVISRVTCHVMIPDAGCQNKRKLCLCDSVCGLSCVRPEKECPELPDPEDGQVHLTGRHFQVPGSSGQG